MAELSLETDDIAVEIRDDVAVLTLDRPRSLNAFTVAMRRDMSVLLRHYGDGESARGIVITGRGRAFCAGEDLHEAAATQGPLTEAVNLFQDMTRAAMSTCVPLVGAINGIAVGGSAELTLCFDSRIGSRSAEYFFPENATGLVISNGASYLLPRLLGSRALPMVLSSCRVSAAESLALGLLDRIVDGNSVDAAVDLIRGWTAAGSATREHLQLLRPPLEEIERAIALETKCIAVAEQAGVSTLGMQRFLQRSST